MVEAKLLQFKLFQAKTLRGIERQNVLVSWERLQLPLPAHRRRRGAEQEKHFEGVRPRRKPVTPDGQCRAVVRHAFGRVGAFLGHTVDREPHGDG